MKNLEKKSVMLQINESRNNKEENQKLEQISKIEFNVLIEDKNYYLEKFPSQEMGCLITDLFDNGFLEKGDFQFQYEFHHESKPFFPILNRSNNYMEMDNLIDNRKSDKNWNSKKEKNPFFSIASISGGGKTTFIQNYMMRSHTNKFQNSLPIYITFNDKTTYFQDLEQNAFHTINSRLLYFVITHLFKYDKTLKNDYEGLQTMCEKSVSSISIIKFLLDLVEKKGVFLCVDEIMRINDEHTRSEVITILGRIIDDSQDNNVIITTLDYSVTKKYSSESGRKIDYVHMTPLFDIRNHYDRLFPKLDSNLKVLQLLLESSTHPRTLYYLVKEMADKNADEIAQKIESWLNQFISPIINYIYLEALEIFKIALNCAINHKEIFGLDMRLQKDKIYTVGDCLKYGIYVTIVDNYPILNPYITQAILEMMKGDKKIKEYMPAYYLLEVLKYEFDPDDAKTNFSNNEKFMSKLDIFYRINENHKNELFPDNELNDNNLMKIVYSDMFPLAKIYGNGSDKFVLQKNYILNLKYDVKMGSKSCLLVFTLDEYKEFFTGNRIFINIEGGSGYDSVGFDFPKYVTFYQDKFRKTSLNQGGADKRLEVSTILNSYNNCKSIFEEMKKIEIAKQAWNDKNLQLLNPYNSFNEFEMRLVFRTRKNLVENADTKNLQNKNIILLDLDAFTNKTHGILELRTQYFYDDEKLVN